MRIKEKRQVLSILGTVGEALSCIAGGEVGADIAMRLLEDCRLAMETIYKICSPREGAASMDVCGKLEECTRLLESVTEDGCLEEEQLARLLQKAEELEQVCESQLEAKVEIAFVPYKYAMWDCLKSIWEAAKADPSCNCHLVPIPYYDREPDRSLGGDHYEKMYFPPEAEDYREYSFEKETPDIIYFHNPYDEDNNITSVDPRFYSSKLKKYTDMLVYVPYYVSGYTDAYKGMKNFCDLEGYACADRVIAQSENTKKCYAACNVDEKKVLVLGSPKIDAAVNSDADVPAGWKQKLDGRKVLLVNTSIAGILGVQQHLQDMKHMIAELEDREDIGFIWRPHPLLEAIFSNLRPEERGNYKQILEIVEKSGNGILDQEPDMYPAVALSDGLISDYSSLLMQYTFTGKPALSLTGSGSMRRLIVLCDYFGNYFQEDGVTVSDFVDMILQGRDDKKEKRLEYARKSVAYGDGSSGKHIHDAILREYYKEMEQ